MHQETTIGNMIEVISNACSPWEPVIQIDADSVGQLGKVLCISNQLPWDAGIGGSLRQHSEWQIFKCMATQVKKKLLTCFSGSLLGKLLVGSNYCTG
jgi:hypothetical protein